MSQNRQKKKDVARQGGRGEEPHRDKRNYALLKFLNRLETEPGSSEKS